LSFLTHI